jgi:hypothetical protein
MKIHLFLLAAVILAAASVEAHSQSGPGGGLGEPPAGPRFGGAMNKLFGDNTAFSADMEMQVREPGNPTPVLIPGKLAFLEGKSLFEMDLTKSKGTKIPEAAAEQIKSMGLAEITMISRPDKKLAYMVYPGLEAYLETPLSAEEAVSPDAKFTVEITEAGKESVNGRDCAKNRVVVTDEKGTKHNATVWNDPQMKGFPIKIHYQEQGRDALMTFQNVKLEKPKAEIFTPPSGFSRYGSMTEMMSGVLLKRLTGGKKE